MYVCARFHEISAKGLQDIKETKCYGRTDNVNTVYPLKTTQYTPLKLRFSGGGGGGGGGGDIKSTINYQMQRYH